MYVCCVCMLCMYVCMYVYFICHHPNGGFLGPVCTSDFINEWLGEWTNKHSVQKSQLSGDRPCYRHSAVEELIMQQLRINPFNSRVKGLNPDH